MIYNFKRMGFVPEATKMKQIVGAFVWNETPEGHDFWSDQYNNGLTERGNAALDAMIAQYEKEEMK